MRDVIIFILSIGAVLGMFYLRVKASGGWPLLPKSKIQTLFGSTERKDRDSN